MIEGFAREMPEDLMLEAIRECHRHIREICDLQQELYDRVGVYENSSCETVTESTLLDRLSHGLLRPLQSRQADDGKQARADAVRALKEQALAEMIPDPDAEGAAIAVASSRRRGTTWNSGSCAT